MTLAASKFGWVQAADAPAKDVRMKTNVVTVAAQAGAGGQTIAQRLALRLGFRYFDWEVIARAAAEAGTGLEEMEKAEEWPGLFARFAQVFELASGDFDRTRNGLDSAEMAASPYLFHEFLRRAVEGMASQGNCVIFGHAAQAVLQSDRSVYKTLLVGSLANRSTRTAHQENISLFKAKEQVRSADRRTTEYFNHFHHFNWREATYYNLTLNTDDISSEATAEAIIRAIAISPGFTSALARDQAFSESEAKLETGDRS